MSEDARITFYKVTQCGYFRRANDVPEFGGFTQALEDLQAWSRDRPLGHTKTFEVTEDSGHLGVYLLDVRKARGQNAWLLSLWNESASTDGAIASVMPASTVGSPRVVMNDVAPGSIPGFATYFFMLPDEQLIAGIRFQHKVYGHIPMRNYLRGFLQTASRHVVYADGDAVEILGYAEKQGGEPRNLFPRFVSHIYATQGEHQMLRERATSIAKVVRKTVLQTKVAPQRALWQKMLDRAGLGEPSSRPSDVRVQYAMQVDLTKDDVTRLIADWQAEVGAAADQGGDVETEWEDIGFVLRGDANTYWLSHATARDRLQLDVRRDSPEVVNAEWLLGELVRHQTMLLKKLG